MGQWPDLTDYHEAMQAPTRAFRDAQLKQAAIEVDRFGKETWRQKTEGRPWHVKRP